MFDVSNEIKCFLEASRKRILFICTQLVLVGSKVLQHGRTGSGPFANNEPSCPSDVDTVHSPNRSEPQRTPVFCTRESLMCIYLFMYFRFRAFETNF